MLPVVYLCWWGMSTIVAYSKKLLPSAGRMKVGLYCLVLSREWGGLYRDY